MTTKPRRRSAITVLFAAAIVFLLALPAFASADPLGSATFYKEGLRSSALVRNVTPGPDGNVWFVDGIIPPRGIGLITPGGAITEYLSGTNLSGLNAESKPNSIVAGPGGSKYLWFTDESGTTPAIASIDSTSPETATEFCATCAKAVSGLNAGAKPRGIAVGPEGNLWFADASETTPAIGVAVLNAGKTEIEKFEEFKIGPAESGGFGGNPANGRPDGIVAGPDGNLWFTTAESSTNAVGKINPGTHAIEEFPTGVNSEPGGEFSSVGPYGIVAGPDGNVWFAEPGSNEANGQGLCRILTSGEVGKFTCFKGGLIASSNPAALTVAPGGKLWFTDASGVEEAQELEIKATENLGGTYKLSYKGEETGWSGSGNISGFTGTGDVKRAPETGTKKCSFTSGSKNATACEAGITEKAELGMRITCASCSSAIPAGTTITKVEGSTIEMSNAAAATAAGKATQAGWIKNVTYSSGSAAVGMQVAGTGITTSEVIATGELEGKGTIAPATVPTAVGTSIALTGGSKTISGVTTSTGCIASGEEVSGEGIPATTTTTTTSCAPSTLTISKFPTETKTGVTLSANLAYNASKEAIQGALEKLPATKESIGVGGEGVVSPVKREITFGSFLKNADVEQIACNGAGLTGTSASCAVTTTTQGVPNAVGCMTTSGEACGRYPRAELYAGPGGITYMPGENVWLSTGNGAAFPSSQAIAKFGIGDNYPLTVTKTGPGTVTSSPAGINCGGDCEESYFENTEVELTATPTGEAAFAGWSGAGCSGTGTCKVKMSAIKSVSAEFVAGHTVKVEKITTNGGEGTVASNPAGIECGATCQANYAIGSKVTLTASYAAGSSFTSWTGCLKTTEGTGASGRKCTVEITTKALTIKAKFTKVLPVTTVKDQSGGGTGTLSSTPGGIACGPTCTEAGALFTEGAASFVTIKAAPVAASSEYGSWTSCPGTVEEEGKKCKVTVTGGPITVEYKFNAIPQHTLGVTKAGKGTGTVTTIPGGISCGPTCTAATSSFLKTKTVTLKEVPSAGSTFTGWTGDCVGAGETCVVGFMTADKEVTATFE